jgi:hypothetical protein
MSPRAYFLCRSERSEGSLGACALWEDRVRRFLASLEMTEKGGHPERKRGVSPCGRRPERSNGCLITLGWTGWGGYDKVEGYDRVDPLIFYFFSVIQ